MTAVGPPPWATNIFPDVMLICALTLRQAASPLALKPGS